MSLARVVVVNLVRSVVVAGFLAGPGCNAHPIVDVQYEHAFEFADGWCTPARPNVDVLVVVDDSASMALEQLTVAANLRSIVEFYESQSWRMDYRIAVTTTDVGNPWCDPATSDDGALSHTSCLARLHEFEVDASIEGPAAEIQDACREVCSLETIDLPHPWVERIEGITNVPDRIEPAEALACIGTQGVAGCAFEAPLEAMRRTLERTLDPHDPAYGFMRPDAALFVLFVTDEDDCSIHPEHHDVLDPEGARALWSDPDGAEPTSAVCWNAGVRCSGDPNAMTCRSADVAPDGSETSPDEAVLHPLSRYAGMLASIADQKRAVRPESGVFVGVVGGAAPLPGIDPFDVQYARSNDPEHTVAFGIAPGCASERGEAQPPVRMRELVEQFWDGFQEDPLSSICEASYLHALACLPGAYEPPSGCLADCVGDDDPSTAATPSDCYVVERMRDGTERALPPCLDAEGLGAIPPGEPRGCAIVRTGPDLDCDGANARLEVIWRFLPDASCVRTVCRRSLHPSVDCPGLGAPEPISWRP